MPDALAAARDADAAAPGLSATLALASSAGADAERIAAAVEQRLLRRLASFAAGTHQSAAEPRGPPPAALRASAAVAAGGAEWEATVAALEARADAVLQMHAAQPGGAAHGAQPRRPWVTP